MTREDAIEIMRKNMPSDKSLPVYEAIQTLIPELAESEDERIRKGIIDEIKAILRGEDLGFPPQDVLESRLAYLEKQKEQKQEWKPQPESLEALMYAIEGKWDMISPTSYLSRRLEDLYEGLVNTFNVDESLIAKLPN